MIMFKVMRNEFRLVLADQGVLVFFLLLCFVYPILYSLIYNTEVARDVRVVVVDDSRSHASRKIVRHIDATPEVSVIGVVPSMSEARDCMARKECYAIIHIDRDFGRDGEGGMQRHISAYCDMSVMVRYKNVLSGLVGATQDDATRTQAAAVAPVLYNHGGIVNAQHVPIGNSGMGMASAILLFVLPLVLQQSMLLGIGMLHGGSIERRRHCAGHDPLEVKAGVVATVLGKSMCYLTIYALPTVFVLHVTPHLFDFPQNANPLAVLALSLPFLLGVSLMGQTIKVFINERESTFLMIVFSSIVFIFLSGASWPRFEISTFWKAVGDVVPGVWMSNAYVLMQSDGASLWQVARHVAILWGQCAIFFALACLVEKYVSRPRYARYQALAQEDPGLARRMELHKNGD